MNYLSQIPDKLRDHAKLCHQQFQQLIKEHNISIKLNKEEYSQILRVLCCSDFILQTINKQTEWFFTSLKTRLFNQIPREENLQQCASQLFTSSHNLISLSEQLRKFRNQQLCQIAWRDITGDADLCETLSSLSQLAEICIKFSLRWLHNNLKKEFGTPINSHGQKIEMIVLAMGKLGACELNFSSDIDLVFVFPEHGKTINGKRCISHNEYFIKLGQQLIKLLSETTTYGFVFRVDMRLRPFGKSGPLAITIDAMEDYYAVHGREWERYALIKARPITGNKIDRKNLQQQLKPFIYRRYIDYSVFESLREMKAMINRQVKQKHLEHNIKLGAGGIREIEFLAQAFQLLRGGKETEFQQQKLQLIIPLLSQKKIITDKIAEDLLNAYHFLRNTEHRLQEVKDQQIHCLPENTFSRARLAFSMGFNNWESFSEQLKQHRQKVQDNFLLQFLTPQFDSIQLNSQLHGLDILWYEYLQQIDNDEVDASIDANNKAEEILKNACFKNAKEILNLLLSFRQSSPFRKMTANARERLNQLIPLLLSSLARNSISESAQYNTIKRLLAIFESTCRRSVYLSLLIENPPALSQLVKLCSASVWISRELTKTPALLDELLKPHILYSPLNYKDLTDDLQLRLEKISANDLEQQMEVLCQFKLAHVLRVAATDITGIISIMQVSDYLTWIAQTILQQVIKIAWQDTLNKIAGPQIMNGFALIGYGKVGGYELGYSSDLDLVFVFKDDLEKEALFFTRLSRRILFILGTRTYFGLLYECDMRLRPNGNSGQITSTLKAFKKYEKEKAWTWEHQALCRARIIAGDKMLIKCFSLIRQEILCQPREQSKLQHQIHKMRIKMQQSQRKKQNHLFDIKQDPGGIIDIEFMVQYLILLHAEQYPEIVEFSDNIRMINSLVQKKLLSSEMGTKLSQIYQKYRNFIHQQALQELSAITSNDRFINEQKIIKVYWGKIFLYSCN